LQPHLRTAKDAPILIVLAFHDKKTADFFLRYVIC